MSTSVKTQFVERQTPFKGIFMGKGRRAHLDITTGTQPSGCRGVSIAPSCSVNAAFRFAEPRLLVVVLCAQGRQTRYQRPPTCGDLRRGERNRVVPPAAASSHLRCLKLRPNEFENRIENIAPSVLEFVRSPMFPVTGTICRRGLRAATLLLHTAPTRRSHSSRKMARRTLLASKSCRYCLNSTTTTSNS